MVLSDPGLMGVVVHVHYALRTYQGNMSHDTVCTTACRCRYRCRCYCCCCCGLPRVLNYSDYSSLAPDGTEHTQSARDISLFFFPSMLIRVFCCPFVVFCFV